MPRGTRVGWAALTTELLLRVTVRVCGCACYGQQQEHRSPAPAGAERAGPERRPAPDPARERRAHVRAQVIDDIMSELAASCCCVRAGTHSLPNLALQLRRALLDSDGEQFCA